MMMMMTTVINNNTGMKIVVITNCIPAFECFPAAIVIIVCDI
jgi:hypothetical protein